MLSMFSWQYRRKRYRYLERCISVSCCTTIRHSPYALCMEVCACVCVSPLLIMYIGANNAQSLSSELGPCNSFCDSRIACYDYALQDLRFVGYNSSHNLVV